MFQIRRADVRLPVPPAVLRGPHAAQRLCPGHRPAGHGRVAGEADKRIHLSVGGGSHHIQVRAVF